MENTNSFTPVDSSGSAPDENEPALNTTADQEAVAEHDTTKIPAPQQESFPAAQQVSPDFPDSYPPPQQFPSWRPTKNQHHKPAAKNAEEETTEPKSRKRFKGLHKNTPKTTTSETTTISDQLVGQTIDGRYFIETRIARGGMATVYRARDTRLDRQVALKIMYPHLAESAEFVARFRREARAAAKLTHSGVVAVYDQGSTDGSSYLVMELVKGPNLRSYLRSQGCLPVGEALEITKQILSALAAAHRNGLVHRDVKPENVLIPPGGFVKVADFGLARAASEVTAATTGSILGTVAYLSPETVQGTTADGRVDVYAAGIMLFEMLAGVVPFTGDSPIQIAYAHVNQDIPHLNESQPWIPNAVDELVAKLTQRDPQRRPANAGAALELVEQTLTQLDPEELRLRGTTLPTANSEVDTESQQMITPTLNEVPLPNLEKKSSQTKHSKKKIIATVSVSLLVVAGILAWYFLLGPGAYRLVPNVTNQQWAGASQTLKQAEIPFERVDEFSDTVAEGNVSKTQPAGGKKIWRFASLKVFVSKGIEMLNTPDLANNPVEDATRQIKEARFGTPQVSENYHDSIPAGQIISQEPKAGQRVPHNTVIKITVSKGREPVTVPYVTGKLRDEATTMLSQVGLVTQVNEEFSDTVSKGRVISQNIAANTTLYRNDQVVIVVSKGPRMITVPDVTRKSQAKATQILQDAGLKVKVTKIYNVIGVVAETDPKAGTTVEAGSTVTLRMI